MARALLADAPLLLLDDALSAVDTQTEARILSHLRQARVGRTVIIVSHRLSAVADTDHTVVLHGGHVVEARQPRRADRGQRLVCEAVALSPATGGQPRCQLNPWPRRNSTPSPAPRRNLFGDAAALLVRAAAPERRQLVQATGWLLLAAALDALGPLAGKFFIDNYLLPRRIVRRKSRRCFSRPWSRARPRLRYLQLVRLAGVAMRSVQRIREQVFRHVLRLPMAFFDRAITGQLVSRVTNDTEAVKTLYVQVLFVILDSLIILLGAMAAMLWLDWRLMLIVAAVAPAVAVIVSLYQRLSGPAVTRTRELRSELNAQVSESIAGMPVLQATNATERFTERFGALNEGHYRSRQRELRANAWLLRPVLDFLNVLLVAVVMGVWRARPAALSALEVGILYAFINYISRVVEPLIQITMQFSQLQQALVGAARVQALLAEAETPVAGEQGQVTGGRDPERLTFAYQPGRPVLHDVGLRIPAGSFHGVVGHTGSGKTTLLSLLLRFYPAAPGSIRIDGAPGCDRRRHLSRQRGPGAAGTLPAGGHGAGKHHHGPQARRRAGAGGSARRACTRRSSRPWSAATTPRSVKEVRACRWDRSSCSPLRGRSRAAAHPVLDEATSHIDSETEQLVQRTLMGCGAV